MTSTESADVTTLEFANGGRDSEKFVFCGHSSRKKSSFGYLIYRI